MNNEAAAVLLEARGLKKTYDTGKASLPVLRGVDITLRAGELTTLIGASGSGKSTLLHLLGGMDSPDEGQVFLEGDDIHRLSGPQRARIRNRRIGFIFQFFHLLPEFTALENVMLPALLPGAPAAEGSAHDRALELLTRVGLAARAGHKPAQLSGGEMQRVAFARALINNPVLVLADEPTGNLDTRSSAQFVELLTHFNREQGKTFLIATHNPGLAGLGTRRLEMRDGYLVSPSA